MTETAHALVGTDGIENHGLGTSRVCNGRVNAPAIASGALRLDRRFRSLRAAEDSPGVPEAGPLSGCQPAPKGYSPTLQWQQQQVAQFSAVRQSVNRHRSHWKSQQLDSNVTMPKSEDEEGWKKFCLGERLCAEGAVGPATSESSGIDYVKIGFPPLLSIVSRMNQATVTSVLEYLSNWFGERDFTPELGRWFYALLACLEKPLLPEAHSLIRQLARRCSEVRLLVDSKDDERVPALNLLICLVSRYFDQRDLADEPS
ncbi:gem-associated protein 2 isoform X2 [Manis javanica]|uniref:gem-associated protein 2 isoform X2 n=1 Tax=Manis javanica TaxID=9974 RepID=UPI0018795640|nr:gem-associated protein 2 isoform X2 [Manis javanica]